ncbi:MAG TPA: hypothetical protein VGR80_12475, partial [Steroidobacteraceae bacterium]|nr:hypothetical protein [Steroidobacteraceae bacterium]
MSLTPLLAIAALLVAGGGAADLLLYPPTRAPLTWLAPALAAAAFVALIVALVVALRTRRTVEKQRASADARQQENDRNQQAILRLLDELSSLADGDLTVQATVTEDITG